MAKAPAGAADQTGAVLGPAIHTEDLTKIYAGTDFTAVDRLNLNVQVGEIFGCWARMGRARPPPRAC